MAGKKLKIDILILLRKIKGFYYFPDKIKDKSLIIQDDIKKIIEQL